MTKIVYDPDWYTTHAYNMTFTTPQYEERQDIYTDPNNNLTWEQIHEQQAEENLRDIRNTSNLGSDYLIDGTAIGYWDSPKEYPLSPMSFFDNEPTIYRGNYPEGNVDTPYDPRLRSKGWVTDSNGNVTPSQAYLSSDSYAISQQNAAARNNLANAIANLTNSNLGRIAIEQAVKQNSGNGNRYYDPGDSSNLYLA